MGREYRGGPRARLNRVQCFMAAWRRAKATTNWGAALSIEENNREREGQEGAYLMKVRV